MRYYCIHIECLVAFALIVMSSSCLAQKSPGWDLESVNDTLFMDARETSLADWYNFLAAIKDDISEDSARSLVPDTASMHPALRPLMKNALSSLYEEINCEAERYEKPVPSERVYRKSKKINAPLFLSCTDVPNGLWDYPVTGISYQQATQYVLWRNSVMKKANESWEFRLPSPAEWEMVARWAYERSIITYKGTAQEYKQIFTETGRNLNGCLLINIRNDTPCDTDKKYAAKDSKGGLFPSHAFFPNIFGVYTLQGNVSEMTSEKGIAAGGNFTLPMDQAHFNSTQSYTKPEYWLGFRCVAERR